MSNRLGLIACIAAIGVAARAQERLRAVPFVFVGSASECGGVAGSNIVTSAWLRGMGLPDNDQPNTTLAGRDPHSGLLLNKNGPTADCSAAGARIRGVEGIPVDAVFPVGFDIRNGTHCGAGAPRFNLSFRNGSTTGFRFVGGCANGVRTPAPQDPLEWQRVRIATVVGDPVPPGSTVESLTLIFDEGTDTALADDPEGVGLAVVDNIFVNGQSIRSGRGIAEPDGDRNDRD